MFVYVLKSFVEAKTQTPKQREGEKVLQKTNVMLSYLLLI